MLNLTISEEIMMITGKVVSDERTLRDIPVIVYLLSQPTGDQVKDAKNAALADEHSAALEAGTVVGFISDEAPNVLNVRRKLGQIS